jgi:formamidopyrimidine-DNA glycosylase
LVDSADFLEASMLTTEIILCLATLGNIGWAYWNYRTHRNRTLLYQVMERSSQTVKAHADDLLRAAMNAANNSLHGQEYKVCSVCQRIVALHETDESGKTVCANCMLQRTKDLARVNHG